jgi:dTMP kinase
LRDEHPICGVRPWVDWEVIVERGKFIVIEGIDGAGTTTLSKRLVSTIQNSLGVDSVIWTNEPSRGPVGQFIRAFLKHEIQDEDGEEEWTPSSMTMAHLFTSDRLDHLRFEIEPALSNGQHVICDRYYYSTLGYQALTMNNLVMDKDLGRSRPILLGEAFESLRPLLEHCREPDLVIVLNTTPEEAARRCNKRRGRREVFEVDELQVRLAEFYRILPVLDGVRFRAPGKAFCCVDGNRPQDEVFMAALGLVRQELLF